MKFNHLLRPSKMRWSLAAHDICFTCAPHSYLFSLGKCVPVIRGAGVYQEAVDFMIEQLAKGAWVHVFPEGNCAFVSRFATTNFNLLQAK